MDLLSIITDVHLLKVKNKIQPDHVTQIEVINKVCEEIRIDLNRLVKEGHITEVDTLNDKAYIIK